MSAPAYDRISLDYSEVRRAEHQRAHERGQCVVRYELASCPTIAKRLPIATLKSSRWVPHSGPSVSKSASRGSSGAVLVSCSQLAPLAFSHWAEYSPGVATHGVVPFGTCTDGLSGPGKGSVE